MDRTRESSGKGPSLRARQGARSHQQGRPEHVEGHGRIRPVGIIDRRSARGTPPQGEAGERTDQEGRSEDRQEGCPERAGRHVGRSATDQWFEPGSGRTAGAGRGCAGGRGPGEAVGTTARPVRRRIGWINFYAAGRSAVGRSTTGPYAISPYAIGRYAVGPTEASDPRPSAGSPPGYPAAGFPPGFASG